MPAVYDASLTDKNLGIFTEGADAIGMRPGRGKGWLVTILERRLNMVRMNQKHFEHIRSHSERTYPHECCGVLLGRFEESKADTGLRIVDEVREAGNTRTDSAHNRYNIDPRDLVRIQREGREQGLEIVGFYHSHPDHPAQWSKTDLAEAHWLGCSYVITSVEQGKAADTNSFYLAGPSEEGKQLMDELVAIDI